MVKIFMIGDTHFGHGNILNFKREDGTPVRPFQTVDEMDWEMVVRWNRVVQPQDHVYHLGDVAIKRDGLEMMMHLNGHKRLIHGNHDIFKTKDYLKYFEEIRGVRVIDDFVLTHIPLHPESLRGDWVNIHGHLHNNKPAMHLGPRYFNVSAEMVNYTPIELGEVKEHVRKGTRPRHD